MATVVQHLEGPQTDRVEWQGSVRFRAGGFRYHHGRLENLGSTGARLVSQTPLGYGSRVQVTIEVEPGWSIATASHVVWCREHSEPGTWVAEVRFGSLWDDDAERLDRWVRSAGLPAQAPSPSSAATSVAGALWSGSPVMPDLGWL